MNGGIVGAEFRHAGACALCGEYALDGLKEGYAILAYLSYMVRVVKVVRTSKRRKRELKFENHI
jgi:hypothetical protein